MKNYLFSFVVAIAAILFSANAFALTEQQEANIAKRVAEYQERLNLTPEQLEQIKPIIRETAEQKGAVYKSFGITQGGGKPDLGFFDKRKLKKQIKKIRKSANERYEAVLSEDQMDELKKIRKERREKMKEKHKNL